MYNPLSVYTVLPWAIIFNVSEVIIMFILDAAIGEPFNNIVKAVICLLLFIINYVYILYTIYIHIKVLYHKINVKIKLYPITLTDLFNILISNCLIWNWLFMSLFFFDKNLYSNVVTDNKPRLFVAVFFKFLAYTIIATNAGFTTIQATSTISELFSALGLLNYQIITILILGGLLAYFMDLLKEINNDTIHNNKPQGMLRIYNKRNNM